MRSVGESGSRRIFFRFCPGEAMYAIGEAGLNETTRYSTQTYLIKSLVAVVLNCSTASKWSIRYDQCGSQSLRKIRKATIPTKLSTAVIPKVRYGPTRSDCTAQNGPIMREMAPVAIMYPMYAP